MARPREFNEGIALDAAIECFWRRGYVHTAAGQIEFIVSYSRWWGWWGRPVAVPLEKLGIEGRQLVSLEMPPSDYAAAPTWHNTGTTPLRVDATVRVALARS